uniref:Sushi domain-containing protein n=1 Tax=Monopterus albus TaxID=43700 RepID=A0A3Q3JZH6_MONAL|nr:sushi domain-containing protein 5 [Monopterus albus]
MLDRCNQIILSLLFGCLACLVVTSVVNAGVRVFVLELRNSSGLQGFREAERACTSLHTRLASAEELRYAVLECFFSPCTRGWLYEGTVGTTVCNTVGSALKAVDVRTENATEDTAQLDAFCIRDKEACGDPPSFPNAHLQGHTGFGIGDELLYMCVPGYVMPSGDNTFRLLCDSCGEWYGLVQVCIKDEAEGHVDYEDKLIDSYGEVEHHSERPEDAHGQVYEEEHEAAYPESNMSQKQQETSFSVEGEEKHGEHKVREQVNGRKSAGTVERGEKGEHEAVEDFTGRPRWEQERREMVRTSAAAVTEAPVSLLSQKHMFWFPSETFQEGGHPVSSNPVTETTQRVSGTQSEESKEQENQERHHHQHPVDVDDHDHDSYDDHDTRDRHDHDDSRHDNIDDHDSHQDEDDHDDHVEHYIPAQHDDLNRRDYHQKHASDHDDHYDMGEREDDGVRLSSQEYDNRDVTYDKHESYEDHKDVTDDRGDDDRELPHGSEEHPDHDNHDDGEEHFDLDEDKHDHHTDDHNSHYDHDRYDDHDSHKDDNNGHQRATFSVATDEHTNVTQKAAGGKATTDETWLDGYPVIPEEADSTTERVGPQDRERGKVVRTTNGPSEGDIHRPIFYTSLPEQPESFTTEPELEHVGEEEVWPGFTATATPSTDHPEPSDFPSNSDTLDYDTQQAAPTHSWLGDLTEHPFLNHGPVPTVHDNNILPGVMGEHTVHDLTGETGERSEMEGEKGKTICTGGNCPPHPPSSSSQVPTVAAIIVVVCAVAAAIIVGVWCYRRQQQKSSIYEMNGKGQSQSRQGQQIEMQQKV